MEIIYFFVTLSLLVAAFIFGMKTADRYHRQAIAEQRYALEKQYARLLASVDADDTAQPYVAPPKEVIGTEFANRLRRHGRATQQIQ